MRSGNERMEMGKNGKEQSDLMGWESICEGNQPVFNLFEKARLPAFLISGLLAFEIASWEYSGF